MSRSIVADERAEICRLVQEESSESDCGEFEDDALMGHNAYCLTRSHPAVRRHCLTLVLKMLASSQTTGWSPHASPLAARCQPLWGAGVICFQFVIIIIRQERQRHVVNLQGRGKLTRRILSQPCGSRKYSSIRGLRPTNSPTR